MNCVDLIGRVTREIRCAYTAQSQKAVAHFILAVKRERSEDATDFIPCEVWDKQAENMEKMVQKGELIAVHGSLRSGSYTAKNGDTVYTLDLHVQRFEFLETKASKQAKLQEHAQINQAKSTVSTKETAKDDTVSTVTKDGEQLPAGYEYISEEEPF